MIMLFCKYNIVSTLYLWHYYLSYPAFDGSRHDHSEPGGSDAQQHKDDNSGPGVENLWGLEACAESEAGHLETGVEVGKGHVGESDVG